MLNINSENSFNQIKPGEVPEQVADNLISRGGLYVSRGVAPTAPQDFGNLRYLEHENGDVSYLADQTKTYVNGDTEEIIHLVDTDDRSEVTGVGEVRFNRDTDDDYFRNKPFVGWTSTEKAHQNEGLGRRRLLVMRLATASEFGLALHSDTLLAHRAAVKIWERLIDNGLAEQYEQVLRNGESTPRYKFK